MIIAEIITDLVVKGILATILVQFRAYFAFLTWTWLMIIFRTVVIISGDPIVWPHDWCYPFLFILAACLFLKAHRKEKGNA